MSDSQQAKGHKSFLGLAIVILGGLIFAAGVMVGRQIALTETDESADPLNRIDERDKNTAYLDNQELIFPEVLSKPMSEQPVMPLKSSLTKDSQPKDSFPVLPPTKGVNAKNLAPKESPTNQLDPVPVETKNTTGQEKGTSPRAADGNSKDNSPENNSSGKAKPMALQLASYRERNQAQDLINKLSVKGYPKIHLWEGEVVGKGLWYRVRLGPFLNIDEVEQLKVKLQKEQGLNAMIVSGEDTLKE